MESQPALDYNDLIQAVGEMDDQAVTFAMREPVLRTAVKALAPPSGSKGLDAGCGYGLQTLMLAEETGPEGQVTGLDFSPGNLKTAEKITDLAGYSKRVSYREGDVRNLLFENKCFG